MSRFWDEVREAEATQFCCLGSIMHMLLSQPPSELDRAHRVERVFSAPAPPKVLYRLEARFGVHVIEGYGQTEIKNVLYNPVSGRKIGSMGRPTASTLMEIHDEHGNAVGPGVVGELVYRPKFANVMPKFMAPRYVRLLPVLRRTPTGKVQKVLLREQGVTADTWDITTPRAA